MNRKKAGIYIEPGRKAWAHEMHVAEILALAGHRIEFLKEGTLPTADILLNGIEFEIKSPETAKLSSIEQLIRKALKQSPNIIIDASRCKIREDRLRKYLAYKARNQKQIKKLLLITKNKQIIDIMALV